MGSHTICIKDMAGLIAPYDAYDLVSALKKVVKVQIGRASCRERV